MPLTPDRIAELRTQIEVSRCLSCEKVIVGRRILHQEVFQPFAGSGDVYTYCEPCSDRGDQDWESAMWCEGCDREVWESNGHRPNFKVLDGQLYCVRCVQDFYFKHGHTEDEIEGETIPCDFYNHQELEDQGWEEGEAFSGSMLERTNGEEWRVYCRSIKEKGGMVLTDQGRTSIIGGPDSVTVWVKYPERKESAA